MGHGWQKSIGSELRKEGQEQGESAADPAFDRMKEFEEMLRGRSH